MLQLTCYNFEIDWRMRDIKITRCLEKSGRQQKNCSGRNKRKKKKRKKNKRCKKKKSRKKTKIEKGNRSKESSRKMENLK